MITALLFLQLAASSLYVTDLLPVCGTEPDTFPCPNFHQVGVLNDGRVVLHAAPGQEPLPDMFVVIDGSETPNWQWQELFTRYPTQASRIMEGSLDLDALRDRLQSDATFRDKVNTWLQNNYGITLSDIQNNPELRRRFRRKLKLFVDAGIDDGVTVEPAHQWLGEER